MFSAASKLGFTVAAGAAIAAIVYAAAVGDRNGAALLVGAAVVAFLFAVAAFFFVGPTEVAIEAADADTAPQRLDPAAVPGGSTAPVITAAAGVLTAVSLATERWVLWLGLLVAVIAALVWLAHAWTSHPAWDTAMTDRLNQRFVVPVGLPVLVVVLVAIGAVSFSRILLAVSASGAAIVAIVAAVALLVGFTVVAMAERVGRAAIGVLSTMAAVLVVGAGITGAVVGEREFHHAFEGIRVVITDDGVIHPTALHLPQLTEISITVANEEEGVTRQFLILRERGGDVVFEGPTVEGPGEETFVFTTPDVGAYWLQLGPGEDDGLPLLVAEVSNATGKPGLIPNASTTSTTTPDH